MKGKGGDGHPHASEPLSMDPQRLGKAQPDAMAPYPLAIPG
jgi:hypothetical protein